MTAFCRELETGKGPARTSAPCCWNLGFDPVQHEQIRSDLKSGRIGLAQNRLPASSDIRDVEPGDVLDGSVGGLTDVLRAAGEAALANGEVAVVTLAAGVGSRWTQGAGVVKALHPFAKLGGRHRTFLEVHLAKSRQRGQAAGMPIPHIFTTSSLTHAPLETFLREESNYAYPGLLLLSPGRAIGLRLVPTVRDLRFAWEEMPQQTLDAQQQKVRESLRAALIGWAKASGEASRLPGQPAGPVPASGRPLVRSPEPAQKRHAGVAAPRSPAASVFAGPQH